MNLARVTGRVWATRKLPDLEGLKFLVLQPMDLVDGSDVGSTLLAVGEGRSGLLRNLQGGLVSL